MTELDVEVIEGLLSKYSAASVVADREYTDDAYRAQDAAEKRVLEPFAELVVEVRELRRQRDELLPLIGKLTAPCNCGAELGLLRSQRDTALAYVSKIECPNCDHPVGLHDNQYGTCFASIDNDELRLCGCDWTSSVAEDIREIFDSPGVQPEGLTPVPELPSAGTEPVGGSPGGDDGAGTESGVPYPVCEKLGQLCPRLIHLAADNDELHVKAAGLTSDLVEAKKLLADVVAKATDFGVQDGDFVANYLLPTGPIHRAIPWLDQRGISVRPGRIPDPDRCPALQEGPHEFVVDDTWCLHCGERKPSE